MALLRLVRSLGVDPQMVAGHSYGEFVALFAAGCFDEESLLLLSEARGRFIREGASRRVALWPRSMPIRRLWGSC